MHFFDQLQVLEKLKLQGRPFVQVTVTHLRGSNPAPVGAKMWANEEGLFAGTVGGGKIEKKALELAAIWLKEKSSITASHLTWNLQQDLGMSCGGEMSLFFELFLAQDHRQWSVVLFGAGHVAQALVRVLLPLDCRLRVFDSRQEWLDRLPVSEKLEAICCEELAAQVPALPPHSFILLMTQGHATDLPVLAKILRTRAFPYVGVIGSKQKRLRLLEELKNLGVEGATCGPFYCPMGLSLGSNTPEEIAISIAAQLLKQRDELNGGRTLKPADENSSEIVSDRNG